ncbi:hypothetical protein BTUL_0016g01040 [Botrytis tulipae]|uniref:Uncharacterized protein n=1 Tax=Botrytis tulipae TaxID=87230 RepID=A0A4Z1F3Q9_9HELO|nr:hypothetical protein BTUL_0016g01040 [Botrytis tulipae]
MGNAIIHSCIYGLREGRREIRRDEKWHLDHAGKSNIIGLQILPFVLRMPQIILACGALSRTHSLMWHCMGAVGYVDLRDWYNFVTFDIVGDLCLGEAFGTLKSGSYHYWIEQILVGLKFMIVIRFAQAYPLFRIILALPMNLVPGVKKQKQVHKSDTPLSSHPSFGPFFYTKNHFFNLSISLLILNII